MKIHALLQLSAFGFGVIASGVATATPLLDVAESVAIAVPPEKVWNVVGNFSDLGWHPAVASTRTVAGSGNARKTARSLMLKDGAIIVEQLRMQDDESMSQRYAMLESPLPVTDYEASITVHPDGAGSSRVTWESRFRRKEGTAADDASVAEIIHGIFSAGLESLKKQLEAQE